MSPAADGVSGADEGAKLDDDVGSIAGGSGAFGGAGGSLMAEGDDRKGDDLNGSAGGAAGVGSAAGTAGAAGASLALDATGENEPEVVVDGGVELDSDELTGVIVGAGGVGTSSSSSSSSSSRLRLSSVVGWLNLEIVSPVISAAGATGADSASSPISSSKSSSSSNASASSSLIPTAGEAEAGGVGDGGGGGGGGGEFGSPIMLRRSGAPGGVDNPEPGVEKELEDGPTSNVDSLGVAGAPMIDVLCGGGGGGGVNSTGGPAEKSGPMEIS